MSIGKPIYQELINTIRNEYDKIAEHGYDISDFGNAIGSALGEEFKDKDAAGSFAWGIDHGVSLIDGSHDDHNLREWVFSLRDRDNSWWKFTLQKIKNRMGIHD